MSQPTKRNLSLDMVKGLMILWVPTVHLLAWDVIPEIARHVPDTLFSSIMISFFVLSGYVYHPGKRSWAENAKRRTFQLLKPFAIWTLVTLAVNYIWLAAAGHTEGLFDTVDCWWHAVLYNQNIDTGYVMAHAGSFTASHTLQIMMMLTQMGPYWFMGTMLISSLVFFALSPMVKKSIPGTIGISLGLILLSGVVRTFVSGHLPFRLEEVPAYTGAMLLGCLAGDKKLFDQCPLSKGKFLLSCIPVLAILWFLYPVTGSNLDLGDSVIWHPAVKVVMSFLQLYVMIFAFQMLKDDNPVGRFFTWVGQNTLTILLGHDLFACMISLFTGLYFVSTWGYLTSIDEMFSMPADAVPQSAVLLLLTVAAMLLFCCVRDRIGNAMKVKRG